MFKSIVPDCWHDPQCEPSPLSRSESGDDAPLHWLRGPRTGDRRPRSERETLKGRSRLLGRLGGGGEEEEQEQEEKLEKGQGDWSSPWGLLRDEPRLEGEWHSSSSDISWSRPPPRGASSSKQSDATVKVEE